MHLALSIFRAKNAHYEWSANKGPVWSSRNLSGVLWSTWSTSGNSGWRDRHLPAFYWCYKGGCCEGSAQYMRYGTDPAGVTGDDVWKIDKGMVHVLVYQPAFADVSLSIDEFKALKTSPRWNLPDIGPVATSADPSFQKVDITSCTENTFRWFPHEQGVCYKIEGTVSTRGTTGDLQSTGMPAYNFSGEFNIPVKRPTGTCHAQYMDGTTIRLTTENNKVTSLYISHKATKNLKPWEYSPHQKKAMYISHVWSGHSGPLTLDEFFHLQDKTS